MCACYSIRFQIVRPSVPAGTSTSASASERLSGTVCLSAKSKGHMASPLDAPPPDSVRQWRPHCRGSEQCRLAAGSVWRATSKRKRLVHARPCINAVQPSRAARCGTNHGDHHTMLLQWATHRWARRATWPRRCCAARSIPSRPVSTAHPPHALLNASGENSLRPPFVQPHAVQGGSRPSGLPEPPSLHALRALLHPPLTHLSVAVCRLTPRAPTLASRRLTCTATPYWCGRCCGARRRSTSSRRAGPSPWPSKSA